MQIQADSNCNIYIIFYGAQWYALFDTIPLITAKEATQYYKNK